MWQLYTRPPGKIYRVNLPLKSEIVPPLIYVFVLASCLEKKGRNANKKKLNSFFGELDEVLPPKNSPEIFEISFNWLPMGPRLGNSETVFLSWSVAQNTICLKVPVKKNNSSKIWSGVLELI